MMNFMIRSASDEETVGGGGGGIWPSPSCAQFLLQRAHLRTVNQEMSAEPIMNLQNGNGEGGGTGQQV